MAHVNLQKYSTHAEGYTEYFMIVSYLGSQWSIKKRFSDFVKLDTFMKQKNIVMSAELPARTWWQRFDPFVLQQRLKDLQVYISAVLSVSSPIDNPALHKFLEVDVHMAKLTKSNSLGVLCYQERLRMVIDNFRKIILISQPPNIRLKNALIARRAADKPVIISRGHSKSPFLDESILHPNPTNAANGAAVSAFPRTDSWGESRKSRSSTITPKYKPEDAPVTRETRRESVSVFNLSVSTLTSNDHVSIASEVMKKQQFLQYMNKNILTFENHCMLVLSNFNKPAVTTPIHTNPTSPTAASAASKQQSIITILNAPLAMEDLLDLLDDCADTILEASMQHYSLTLAASSNRTSDQAMVVKEFKEYTPSRRDGEMLGGHYSRSSSGSKYSYFNKELKRLSTNDRSVSGYTSKPPTPKLSGISIEAAAAAGYSVSGSMSSSEGVGMGLGISFPKSSPIGISCQNTSPTRAGTANSAGMVSAGSSYIQPSSIPNRPPSALIR